MNRKLLILFVIWGVLPMGGAFSPAAAVWMGTSLYAQAETTESTDNNPGFWEQLRSVLKKKEKLGDKRESVTEKYDVYYDWIHRDEYKLYDSLSKLGVTNWDQYQNILTVDIKQSKDSISTNTLAPNIRVFGWYPYWMGTAYKSFRFNLLSYLSWFSYNVDPETGKYNNPDVIGQWKQSQELIDMAHSQNCKVLLSVTNHTETGNRIFLQNTESQRILIDSLIALLKVSNGDGVDVNFELVPDGLEEEMTTFLQTLSTKLKGANRNYILTVDLPVVDNLNTYQLPQLESFVDLFIVMGYDFYNLRSQTDGPVAPLHAANGNNSIKQSVNQYLQKGLNRKKIILGLPYYGAIWTAKSAGPGQRDTSLKFQRHITYRELKARYRIESPAYDLERWSGYYIHYNQDSAYYEKCWFDDSLTLNRKLDWILQENLAGMGIWALGYDNGTLEFWNLINAKLARDTMLVYSEPIIESRYYNLSRSLVEYRPLIAIAGIFIVLFLFAGLAVGLFDWKVREVFFQNKTLRLLYAIGAVGIVLSVFAFYLYVYEKPLLDNNNLLALGIGLTAGVCITLYVSFRHERSLKNLP